MVSLASDLADTIASLPFVPANVKIPLYALSAALTALSWGIANREDANEADQKEQQRLEELFKQCQAEVDKIWSDENWEDKNGLFLLYKVHSATAIENSGNMRFRIEFNHKLDKKITMSYYALNDKNGATQGIDYKGVSDKNPTTFTVPKGVKEWYIDIPIIDDSEKEKDEEFILVVKDKKYSGRYSFVYGYGEAIGTIIDDEKPAIITIFNAIANEADGTINFEISLNRALDKDIILDVGALLNKTNDIGVPKTASYEDFIDIPSSITILKGDISATYTMKIKDDMMKEDIEDFGLFFKPNKDDITKFGFKDEYVVSGQIIDNDNIKVEFLDNSSNEGNNETESKQCKVKVSGLNSLAQNQKVVVYAGLETLTFTSNSNDIAEYTFEWKGNTQKGEDRKEILDGTAYIITMDEKGEETNRTNIKTISAIFTIIDDDKDPDNDLPNNPNPNNLDDGLLEDDKYCNNSCSTSP